MQGGVAPFVPEVHLGAVLHVLLSELQVFLANGVEQLRRHLPPVLLKQRAHACPPPPPLSGGTLSRATTAFICGGPEGIEPHNKGLFLQFLRAVLWSYTNGNGTRRTR